LVQLPGIAAQRIMADGYGFGAEGDWKTAALVRIAKVMSAGLPGGTSFMEDYTYHLTSEAPRVLGAHMLEVCPTLTSDVPSCEIHPLSIGGKQDPVRLVFTATPGEGVVIGLLDLGERFRLVANAVDVTRPNEELPLLPVACAVWEPRPDLMTAAETWLRAQNRQNALRNIDAVYLLRLGGACNGDGIAAPHADILQGAILFASDEVKKRRVAGVLQVDAGRFMIDGDQLFGVVVGERL